MLNPSLYIDRFPLPIFEDLMVELQGVNVFLKVDLLFAYQQTLLEDNVSKTLTISTHTGFFRYLRLPYGISAGSAIFLRIMSTILQGIPGTI